MLCANYEDIAPLVEIQQLVRRNYEGLARSQHSTAFSLRRPGHNLSFRAERADAFFFAFTSCERVGSRREESLFDLSRKEI
jgi:hypothetical protein